MLNTRSPFCFPSRDAAANRELMRRMRIPQHWREEISNPEKKDAARPEGGEKEGPAGDIGSLAPRSFFKLEQIKIAEMAEIARNRRSRDPLPEACFCAGAI